METLPSLRVLNASKNNISYINYKIKSKRTVKKGTQKLDDQEEDEESIEPTKWKQLRYANLSFNRILEINKFHPKRLLVLIIRN